MPLPQWMRGRVAADGRDVWKGKQLPSRGVVDEAEAHYRIYNAATGELLSFGSGAGPGTLNTIVQDALKLRADHPDVRLHVSRVDGPAYPTGGEL